MPGRLRYAPMKKNHPFLSVSACHLCESPHQLHHVPKLYAWGSKEGFGGDIIELSYQQPNAVKAYFEVHTLPHVRSGGTTSPPRVQSAHSLW